MPVTYKKYTQARSRDSTNQSHAKRPNVFSEVNHTILLLAVECLVKLMREKRKEEEGNYEAGRRLVSERQQEGADGYGNY